MAQSVTQETVEETQALPASRYGHDELNFAEFPLVVLADRPSPGVKTIHYEDEHEDPRTGKRIPRKVTITGSDEHGLPTAKDDEVMVGLLYLTKQTNNFGDATVHFNRRDFLSILGWPEEGRYYRRLAESLYRWLGVTVRYENCWWDPDKQRYGTEGFHLLENVSIYDERTRGQADGHGQFALPLSSFTWNAIPFKSFRQDYMKGLDLDLFLSLPGAAAKRAYRFLDKNLPPNAPLAYDLRLFACEKVGMSRNYKPSRLISEVQTTVVDPLEKAHFLAPLDPKQRFIKEAKGQYRVLFARQDQGETLPAPAAPVESGLAAELRRMRLSGKKAREVLAAYPPEYIAAKIDIVDWLRQGKQAGEMRNPAGFLLKALEDDYQPPEGYESRQQREDRERQQREREESLRQRQHLQEEEKRAKEERERADQAARREHIKAFWQGLTTAERAELEERALGRAEGFQRECLHKDGLLADTVRQTLIDDEILRLHPWPAVPWTVTSDAVTP